MIRNPQPKLNLETLKGKKGLLTLQGYFEKGKFKGKGHEEEDLRTMMKTYEYWCHRLFPKFTFDDCLDHLEKLGTKKGVQVRFIIRYCSTNCDKQKRHTLTTKTAISIPII